MFSASPAVAAASSIYVYGSNLCECRRNFILPFFFIRHFVKAIFLSIFRCSPKTKLRSCVRGEEWTATHRTWNKKIVSNTRMHCSRNTYEVETRQRESERVRHNTSVVVAAVAIFFRPNVEQYLNFFLWFFSSSAFFSSVRISQA